MSLLFLVISLPQDEGSLGIINQIITSILAMTIMVSRQAKNSSEAASQVPRGTQEKGYDCQNLPPQLRTRAL